MKKLEKLPAIVPIDKCVEHNNIDSTLLFVLGYKSATLRYQCEGYIGPHNKPNYMAKSHLFHSTFGICHFHYCLN